MDDMNTNEGLYVVAKITTKELNSSDQVRIPDAIENQYDTSSSLDSPTLSTRRWEYLENGFSTSAVPKGSSTLSLLSKDYKIESEPAFELIPTKSKPRPPETSEPKGPIGETSATPIGSLKFAETPSFPSLRLQALARDVSGGDADSDDQGPSSNWFGSFSDDTLSLAQVEVIFGGKENIEGGDASDCTTRKWNRWGKQSWAFRTPISGGVQSATSAHGLPQPALAVRNLMEQARFAHLCTVMSQMHHRREGYPFGSLVDFAPDPMGHPIFSFSPLAIHTRNLLADPRCTLVVQIPGWSGLSNARVTIFGDVFPLPEHQQEWAHKQYIAKHQQGPSQQWGNFYYFRMQKISDIYFIGGFGTVAWVDVKEYEALQPDKIAVDGGEQNLKELNAIFSKPLRELLSSETEVDDAALISIDSKGTDIRVRQGAQFNIQRISFEDGHAVETLEEAKAALWRLINKGQVHKLSCKATSMATFSMAETSSSSTSSSSRSKSNSSSNIGSSSALSPIVKLAQDHLFTILLLLPVDSLISFAMTCKRFRSLTSCDTLWESICRREWGSTSVDALKSSIKTSNNQQLPWMRIYKQVSQLDSVSCHKLSDPDGELMLPTPRASHSLNFVSDCLVLFGGGSEGGQSFSFDAKRDVYTGFCQIISFAYQLFTVPDSTNHGLGFHCLRIFLPLDHGFIILVGSKLNTSCVELKCIAVRNVLAVLVFFAGRDLDDTWVAYIGNDFQRTLKWQKVNSGVPSGRFGHACVVIGDHLVLFGGINDRGMRQNDTWVGQLVLSENLGVTLSWRLLDVRSIAPPPRGAHAACCIDERTMVVHGGIGLYGLRLADTWILELSENSCSGTWRELVTHPSPPARSGQTLTCIQGMGTVLFGGRGLGYDVLHDVWLLQVSEDQLKWVQILYNLQDIPGGASLPRVGHSATLILGGRLLIYGGEDSQRHRKGDFWVLDVSKIPSIKAQPTPLNSRGLQANMWRRLKAKGYKPNHRSFHRASADHSGRHLYVFGGMVDGLLQPAELSGLRFDGELFLVKFELETGI
ncbi:unnamed protein product [Dovyalis caffra]|uniref:F-box domain-containing protein n=1 Tax=Dovyalis caffra TaxID=77055 RepID=A0AAV1QPS7_9ROSI|nr:unnamed protein product [Dovyalis caffra]